MHIHEDERPSLLPYFIASLLIHVLLVAFIPSRTESPSWKEKMVEVFPVMEKTAPFAIADIDKPAVERRPEKARFTGMYDSSVAQETVAISRRQKTEGGRQGAEGRRQEAEKRKQEGKDAERMTVGKKRSLYDIDRKLFASKAPDMGEKKGFEIGGSAALQDYYPDYKIGGHTYLNVLKYPDVEYFVRMKRQFKMTFDPGPPLRSYFSANRVTRGSVEVVMAVSVDNDGNLKELFVLNASGIPNYDNEALRTIRASAPFASPPDRFLEDDGMLRMSWTFTVYL